MKGLPVNADALPLRVHPTVENLGTFLLRHAVLTPDAPAVVEAGADGTLLEVSYAELAARVERYVDELATLGLEVGDRVLVQSDTSSWAVAMLLACTQLGLPFIPMSEETPDQRLRAIVEIAKPALLLQAAHGKSRELPDSVGISWFGPDGLDQVRSAPARPRHRRDISDTDIAYVVFTSGTTGQPKGVVMSHRAVVSVLRSMLHYLNADSHARVATTASLQFDFSLFDIGLTLGAGAALVVVDRERLHWPRRFLSFLNQARVSNVHGVPSIWRPVLQNEPELLRELTSVRTVLFTGESFPLAELRALQKLLPEVEFWNGYGATESMACSRSVLPNPLTEDLQDLPIGTGHPGAELLLFGEDGRPIEDTGIVGEIYLRSPALFSGYWNEPEATSRVLIPDPLNPSSGQSVFRTGDYAYRGSDGDLYFCGRADSQVQLRGHRVELGEVERRLLDHPAVRTAVALLVPRTGFDPVLHAFVVADDVARTELRAFCLQALPQYMAPQQIHRLAAIPVTVNGKTDRNALLALVGQAER
jgi:amino acid adenylation domain-containing protein